MNVKKITWVSLLLAMCVIGANFKILGSIALDSFPAFLGAIILGPIYGAFLGGAGHLMSALLSGFPQTLPLHLVIAGLMGLCMFAFGWIRQHIRPGTLENKVISWIVAYLINVPLNLILLYPVLKEVVFVLFIPLTLATVINLGITEMVYLVLPSRIKEFKGKAV